jgi:hypothetical protein
MQGKQYTAQLYFNVEGAQVTTTCGHKHQLIAKSIQCARWHGKRGAAWEVVRIERGRVVQMNNAEVSQLRAARRWYRV